MIGKGGLKKKILSFIITLVRRVEKEIGQGIEDIL